MVGIKLIIKHNAITSCYVEENNMPHCLPHWSIYCNLPFLLKPRSAFSGIRMDVTLIFFSSFLLRGVSCTFYINITYIAFASCTRTQGGRVYFMHWLVYLMCIANYSVTILSTKSYHLMFTGHLILKIANI